MSDFNLGNFLNNFVNAANPNINRKAPNPSAQTTQTGEFELTNQILHQSLRPKTAPESLVMKTFSQSMLAELKMNNLANLERSLYVKDLMKLPKDLAEALTLIQGKAATGEEVTKLLSKNISLTTLAELIQVNGKEAMNKLILVMSNATKQGITDTSQIKDAIKLINASVSVASQDNPNQVLKSFMLLYLPWLPLQEGVDFELEIEGSDGSEDESATTITIMISTRNYGNIKIILILNKGNSIDLFINCSDKFPKEELTKRIKEESKNHSIQSNIAFEQKETTKTDVKTPQAKVSLSNLKEVNPFLLLMANAVIRHTIDLDNQIG